MSDTGRSSHDGSGQPIDLGSLFNPRSVVLIGVSADPNRLTGRPLRLLRQHGYAGAISIVHPTHDEIDGISTVKSVQDLDDVPDVAVIMVKASAVADIAEECGLLGVRHLVVLSSGFEESETGLGYATRLKSIATKYGMGIVGPNSEGLWYLPSNTILTFGSSANRQTLASGPVAVLSQSGSIGGSIMRRLNDNGVGATAFVSVGNESVLSVVDYLDWLVRNGGVKVVASFLEGITDGHRFLEVVSGARAMGVAVVVLHAGHSAAGRAASASHTGKISSSAEVYEHLFDQAGVIRVSSLSELASASTMLSKQRLRVRHGSIDGAGLAVIGLSGGSRSIIADAACDQRVPLAHLSDTTTEELITFFPDFAVPTNPVDPTGQVLSDPQLFIRTIEAVARDEHTEALLVQYANGGLPLIERHLPTLIAVSQENALPVVVSSLLDEIPGNHPTRVALAAGGIGYAHDPRQAVSAFEPLYRWRAVQSLRPIAALDPARDERIISGWSDVVDWAGQAGVQGPAELALPVGLTCDEVADHLNRSGIQFPLVVKPSPDDVEHKSESGLVYLGLNSVTEVHAAATAIASSVPECGRVLVQEQLSTDIEMFVVFRRDEDFGPVMAVGPGGYFIEMIADLHYTALPASPEEIATALDSTRLARLLNGYRGRPGVNIAATCSALARLGDAYVQLATAPRLIELNPVVIDRSGTLRILDSIVEHETPHSGERS